MDLPQGHGLATLYFLLLVLRVGLLLGGNFSSGKTKGGSHVK